MVALKAYATVGYGNISNYATICIHLSNKDSIC